MVNRINREDTVFHGRGEVQERIRRLRQMKRWDLVTLGQRAELSATTISQIERGRIAPSEPQIARLATALGYSTEFLTRELNLLPTGRPWLRAYADASEREAIARKAQVGTAVEYIRTLRLSPLPHSLSVFDGDPDDEEAVEEHATLVRDAAAVTHDGAVLNAVRAAERLGCVVLPLETELGRHVGMSVRSDDLPVMCIARDNVPGDRQRWTVAHELGHLSLHWNTPAPEDASQSARLERQAHRFAGAFLAPAAPLVDTLSEHGGRVTLRTLLELKAIWGIAIKALVTRLKSLGVIDSDHARSLYKQISARGWNTSEPGHVPVEAAQWLPKSIQRVGGSTDLRESTSIAARSIGGNTGDLYRLVDWASAPAAPVVDLSTRRRRSPSTRSAMNGPSG